MDFGSISVAKEDGLLVYTERRGCILERELLNARRDMLNNLGPVPILAPKDVAIFIVAATDWGQVKTADRSTQSLVVAQIGKFGDSVRDPETPPVSIPGNRPWHIGRNDFVRLHPCAQNRNIRRDVRRV